MRSVAGHARVLLGAKDSTVPGILERLRNDGHELAMISSSAEVARVLAAMSTSTTPPADLAILDADLMPDAAYAAVRSLRGRGWAGGLVFLANEQNGVIGRIAGWLQGVVVYVPLTPLDIELIAECAATYAGRGQIE